MDEVAINILLLWRGNFT